jgi:hypothetical protein
MITRHVHNSASENAELADNPVMARLQQAVNLANENCDRATALAHTLSSQLRDAQSRINELELEADRLVEPLRAEAETAIAKLQSNASARVELTRRDAEARIARMEADTESRVLQLQDELAQAKQLTDQARAEARIAHDRIARAQIEATDRLSRAWAEIEDRVMQLKADLAQTELRADRAEQWLVLVRREIEANLMPSFAAMHERVTGELSRAVSPASETRDNARVSSTASVVSDVAVENESERS